MKPHTLSRPKDGWEQDVVTGWRKVMFWKPGEVHRIKTKMSRRERRVTRLLLRKGTEL